MLIYLNDRQTIVYNWGNSLGPKEGEQRNIGGRVFSRRSLDQIGSGGLVLARMETASRLQDRGELVRSAQGSS